jgi:adenylate cyclase
VAAADSAEAAQWSITENITLRGRLEQTELAIPCDALESEAAPSESVPVQP